MSHSTQVRSSPQAPGPQRNSRRTAGVDDSLEMLLVPSAVDERQEEVSPRGRGDDHLLHTSVEDAEEAGDERHLIAVVGHQLGAV